MDTLTASPPTTSRTAQEVLERLRDALVAEHDLPQGRITVNDYNPHAGVLVVDDVYVYFGHGEFSWRTVDQDEHGRRRIVRKPLDELDDVVVLTAHRWADMGGRTYGFCIPR